MNQGHWEKVRSVFDSALGLPAEEHSSFLDRSCGDDTELRTEVERLLAHLEQADGFWRWRRRRLRACWSRAM
jgi:hypothetical protein